MKNVKKCYRSMGGIAEPVKCLGEQCSAWVESKNIKGCIFVVEAITSIIRNLEKQDPCKKETTKDADENKVPVVVHTSDTTLDIPKEQLQSRPTSATSTGFKTIDNGEYGGDLEL